MVKNRFSRRHPLLLSWEDDFARVAKETHMATAEEGKRRIKDKRLIQRLCLTFLTEERKRIDNYHLQLLRSNWLGKISSRAIPENLQAYNDMDTRSNLVNNTDK